MIDIMIKVPSAEAVADMVTPEYIGRFPISEEVHYLDEKPIAICKEYSYSTYEDVREYKESLAKKYQEWLDKCPIDIKELSYKDGANKLFV